MTKIPVNIFMGFLGSGKKVKVEGFIYDPMEFSSNYFMVSKFVITCCAVDARPIGLITRYDWSSLKENDWIRIEGKFEIEVIDGRENLILIPESLEKIATPNQPYEY